MKVEDSLDNAIMSWLNKFEKDGIVTVSIKQGFVDLQLYQTKAGLLDRLKRDMEL